MDVFAFSHKDLEINANCLYESGDGDIPTKNSHGLQVIKIQEGARHSVLTKLINYLTD